MKAFFLTSNKGKTMTRLEIFNKLADCTSDLERQVWDMPHTPAKLAIESIVQRLDSLVDAVLQMDEPQTTLERSLD